MYTVMFSDGSKFEGGSPNDSLWNEIPDKPIVSVSYALTPFITYRFENYESYCHCVERVQGINKNFKMISKVVIMGKIKGSVHQIIMDSKGNVYQTVVPYGKEYSSQCKIVDGKFAGWLNGRALTGWKTGVENKVPRLEKTFK